MPVFKQYKQMWDDCYDYKGVCSLKDFILAIVGHLIIIGLYMNLWYFHPLKFFKVLFLIYGVFSLFPLLALCCRRFHSAGKGGWLAFLVFLGIGFLFCFCMTLESKKTGAAQPYYGPTSQVVEETPQPIVEEPKFFPDLTIDELCELSLNEMRQLEFRGILDNLSEMEQEQYLSAIKEKQAHRDELRALISKEDLALLDENMIWPLDDSRESGIYIDCITGKIYSNMSGKDVLNIIHSDRSDIGIHWRDEGNDGFPFASKDGLWYDFAARGEYKYPIDIYLCRLERGLLSHSTYTEKLGNYQKYSARPIEEVTTVQKTWEEVYGTFEGAWHDFKDYAFYSYQIYFERIDGHTVASVDCLTGIRYDLEKDAQGVSNALFELARTEREKLNLPYEENFIRPFMHEGYPFMYDPWTKAEYTKPIEMYLARKEAGLLPQILGEDIYNSLDKSKMYPVQIEQSDPAWWEVKWTDRVSSLMDKLLQPHRYRY